MKSLLLAAALLAVAAPAAAVTNLGFETGDTSGWTGTGTRGATTAYGAFTPASGNYFGFVEAGLGVGAYSTLTQSFSMTAGQTIRGVVGFQANDYIPYNDDAYLAMYRGTTTTNIWTSNVAAVGNYGNTGWVNWTFTAPITGTYTLELGVTNRLDNILHSGAVLDVVPEPKTWAMFIVGFGLVGTAARRRKAAIAA